MVICFLIILEESFQIYYREKHTIDYKTPNRVVEYNIENLKIVTRIRRQGLLNRRYPKDSTEGGPCRSDF